MNPPVQTDTPCPFTQDEKLAYFSELEGAIADYLDAAAIEAIKAAFLFAFDAHGDQYRKSGELYITHPVAVTEILGKWRLDETTLMAALLHDVVEDTPVTKEDLGHLFGQQVTNLVMGVSKIERVLFKSQELAQAENIRKIFTAMVHDVRVILIKLADRLHNMETLAVMHPIKCRRIAKETMEIYAPIAYRLGIHGVYLRLSDLSFRAAFPRRALVVEKALDASRNNRRKMVQETLSSFKDRFEEAGLSYDVRIQEKTVASVYHKMFEQKLTFSAVLDVYNFRIIVDTPIQCYQALGLLHTLYKPMPGRFKDYIALPKPNGYQSLHTALIGPVGNLVKIQICTAEMYRVAEFGIVSLWQYRDGDVSFADVRKQTRAWLQKMTEIEAEAASSTEFLENVKVELQPKQIYVITPKGEVLSMPFNITVIDFAYAIHTTVGNHCVGCKINTKVMPLRTILKNGDRVEILTSEQGGPKVSWLGYVKTAKARTQIRHYLKTHAKEETIEVGRRLLVQFVRVYGVTLEEVSATLEQLLHEFGLTGKEDLFLEIGLGKASAAVVAKRLVPLGTEPQAALARRRQPGSVLIRGADGVMIQLANCCHPIPGDSVVGSVHKARTLIVHALECPKAYKGRHIEPNKWIDVQWDMANVSGFFDATLRISASNRPGVLAKVAQRIGEIGSNITYIHFQPTHGANAEMLFTIQVSDRVHLANVMRLLRTMPEIRYIQRVRFPKAFKFNDSGTVQPRSKVDKTEYH